MRKQQFVTLLLLAGLPLVGTPAAYALPEPQQQGQAETVINGTVLDENNEPVIGASVVQKGNKANAVATDAFGHFKMRIAPGAQLEISYVGYQTLTMKAAPDMVAYLQPTTEMLNELVAIGYGTQKKANLTGAVATVDVARTMDSRPVQDVTRALQGAVPGLTITTTNGDFNSDASIKIRGTGTLSNNQTSSPLIVVDGVPVDDMSNLNPEDIADISVLKDAASASIYGTRAAFGVILITTKGGETKDRVSVKYTSNYAWNHASYYPHFAKTAVDLETALQTVGRGVGASTECFGMNYWDVIPYAKAWDEQHGGKLYTDAVELQPFQSWDNVGDYAILPDGTWVRYADWDTGATLLGTSPSMKQNISIDGSVGKTSYRISYGYDTKKGLMRYNPEELARNMVNASVQTEIFSWLKAGGRLAWFNRTYKEPNVSRNSYQYMWRFPSYFETYGYAKDDEGTPYYFRNEMGVRSTAHQDVTKVNQTRLQGWLNAEIIKGLNLQADFTYQVRNMDYNSAYTPGTVWNNWTASPFTLYTAPSQSATTATRQSYRDDLYTINVFATYDHTFAQDHNLKVMLGGTAEREQYDSFYVRRTGLLDNSLPELNLTDGTTYTTSSNRWHRATAGFFGRINYDYKGKYLFEANGRYDGSSRFPAADQWAFFPSFSAGWRFSEESFMKPLSWWSNGKLRASYGHIGNEAVGSNMFISTISPVTASSVHWLQNGVKVSEAGMPTLVSASLTWERVVTTDVGLDLGFFNNSLTAGFDWYQRDTKDMLAHGEVMPAVLGASAPYTNAGSLRTRGWELSLGWNHSFGDADFYVTATLADAITKVTKWNNPNMLIYSYTGPGSSSYTEGQTYGDIWGFETDRYFEKSDFTGQNADGSWNYAAGVADQSGLESQSGFHYGPGDIKYKDLNGDGKIDGGAGTMDDHGDLKVIGNAMPRFEYSFRLGGAWKGFDLDLFFQGVGKRNYWATGSMTIPMAASALGTFEHQQSYNRYIMDVDETAHTYTIVDYDIDQNNMYPNMVGGSGAVNGNISNIGRGTSNFYPQSRYLMNLAYLRLKALTFGYTLPYDITKKALIQKARVYFSADNLWDLYNGVRKYQMDPETTQSYSGTANDGVGGFGRTTPMMRSYSFGLQVTF